MAYSLNVPITSSGARYRTVMLSRMMTGFIIQTIALNSISKVISLVGEINPANYQRRQRGANPYNDQWYGWQYAVIQWHAEHQDLIIHGIEIEQQMSIGSGKDIGW